MSRVGKQPIAIPSGVTVTVSPSEIAVKGGKGELKSPLTDVVKVEVKDGKVLVLPVDKTNPRSRAMWGTTRNNVAGMVEGVSKGFTTKLEIQGVGYRASADKNYLTIALGFSHEIKYAIPAGITIAVEKQTSIAISGHDKRVIGQVAAEIRGLRKPEPYKGKGVRYEGEYIRRKEGKKK
ncbi:MAG: 50S ribosomal protein L6 [Alphaproteobacteria bacterium]|nr:50S ribosomal protein L6 [Alphaproteobacteria bacterium]